MAYLNMNDYENAVKYLDKYTVEDNIINPSAVGAIGDAYAQLNQSEDALDSYEKALKAAPNEYTTPKFLYKASVIALELGKNDVAAKYLNRINDEYPTSLEAGKVGVLLGKAEAGE